MNRYVNTPALNTREIEAELGSAGSCCRGWRRCFARPGKTSPGVPPTFRTLPSGVATRLLT
jgi:hypothetical protein